MCFQFSIIHQQIQRTTDPDHPFNLTAATYSTLQMSSSIFIQFSLYIAHPIYHLPKDCIDAQQVRMHVPVIFRKLYSSSKKRIRIYRLHCYSVDQLYCIKYSVTGRHHIHSRHCPGVCPQNSQKEVTDRPAAHTRPRNETADIVRRTMYVREGNGLQQTRSIQVAARERI